MNMKKTVYLMMLGVMCMLAGCGQTRDAVTERETSAQNRPEASVEESSPAEIAIDVPAERETGSGDAAQITYLGVWEITGCRGTAAVYALSEEEIDGMIGKTVTYEADKFFYDNSEEGGAVLYREEMMTDSRLDEDFGVAYADLGISGSELLHVEAEGVEGNFFGIYFYVVDENTLMIYYDGVFFEAVRV